MADVNIDPETKDTKQLFNQGVKAFVLRDYKNAVDALGRATELMVAENEGDDLHDSLGDVYLYYGKALLALYRQESDPIANLPKSMDTSGMEEQEAEEDEEADNEENEEKDESVEKQDEEEKNGSEEKKNGEETNGDKTKENGDEKEAENEDEDDEDVLKVDEDDKIGAANPDESFLELEPAEPDADEEPSDLQVAWEVLELAKKIFQKRGDKGKRSYAETLTTLGEISLESENYAAAINDFKEALDIEVDICPGDSRKVAETYYNLGVSYASNSCYKEGITNFQKSIGYLEKRIRNLESNEENPEEVQEMKDLIPEIYEKIRDLKSFTDETKKKLDELTKQPELASKILCGADSSSSSKQASDISHLVKRKRKDEEDDEESNPPKKSQ